MFMTLGHLMAKVWCILLTDVNCRILKEPKKIKESSDPYAFHQRLLVPSYNPKVSKNQSPLTSHPYATHSKGECLTLSLSTTASMGREGLRKAQSQSITLCSKCLQKPFWI